MMLVVGDLHVKNTLGYHQYIEDGRKQEKKEIIDFIVEQSKDCSTIVFLGDNFDKQNNPSEALTEFSNLLNRLDTNEKRICILSGNHEKVGSGKTAIDFLVELQQPNWNIATNKISCVGDYVLCPYFTRAELGANTNEEGMNKIMEELKKYPNKILFTHFAISDSLAGNFNTNLFNEIVLPRKELSKMFKLVAAGHVHSPQLKDNILITGSVFTEEVGEKEKFIWKIDEDDPTKIEQIKLPCREIHKLENPKWEEMDKIPDNSIVKIILTDKKLKKDKNILEEKLKKFDAGILLEQYPRERNKIKIEKGKDIMDLNVENLLEVYAKENKLDVNQLKEAFELIKQ